MTDLLALQKDSTNTLDSTEANCLRVLKEHEHFFRKLADHCHDESKRALLSSKHEAAVSTIVIAPFLQTFGGAQTSPILPKPRCGLSEDDQHLQRALQECAVDHPA